MHNIQNITAAFICSQLIDNDYLAFQKRLEAFKNNENRLSYLDGLMDQQLLMIPIMQILNQLSQASKFYVTFQKEKS